MSKQTSSADPSKTFFENLQAHFNSNISCCSQNNRRAPTPIRDKYDYLDEFAKVIVAPCLAVYALSVSNNKLSDALLFIQMFAEAIVAIFTRPIVTGCKGFLPKDEYQNSNRFSFN